MLEDRSYMKEPVFGPKKSITVTMLIILGVCFVVQSILFSYSETGTEILGKLLLTRSAVARGQVWQLLTFQFLHGGFLHILFNGIALFCFGRMLDYTISTRNWLLLYFGGGVAGGLLHALGAVVFPFNFPTPVVGASAGISALLGAVGFLYPAQDIYVYFIRVPARFLFILWAILSIFFILVPAGGLGGMAHGAHLGGLLFGYAYARWLLHMEFKMPKLPSFSFRKPKIFVHKRQPNAWTVEKPSRPEAGSEEFISQEVDPILDKISAHGIQSLTERERKILEAARARMAKR
jgi:membrane associated rhomboid family serine protease